MIRIKSLHVKFSKYQKQSSGSVLYKAVLKCFANSLENIKNIHGAAFNLRLRHMCFPKNFAEVLKTPILQNADRLLLLKHLLKMKIAGADKFLVLMRKF